MNDDEPASPSRAIDRRGLGRLFAFGALSAGLGASTAHAADPPPTGAAESTEPSAPPMTEESPLAQASIAALIVEAIRRTAPERLTPDVLTQIQRDVERSLNRSRLLSSVPLANGDEPATTFRAYRGPDLPKL